jgi:hypothetical protein
MRLLLVGDNAKFLARSWQEHGMVDSSDNEEAVGLYSVRRLAWRSSAPAPSWLHRS